MLTLKQYNPKYEEQKMNNCTVHVLKNAICNRYKKQTGEELNLDVIELGKKISQVLFGDPNLLNSTGGNLETVIKTAQKIDITDEKGSRLIVSDVQKINTGDNSIFEEISQGRAICWSGIGSLTKIENDNWFIKKKTSGSHAMLLDTIDIDNDVFEFFNSINYMERVKCEFEHVFAYTMNCWSFKLLIQKPMNENTEIGVSQKISLEEYVSKPEDQSTGSSCTMFTFENCYAIQMNRAKGKRDTNLQEYNLNTQVEIFYGYPLGYINKNGFNPERIIECFKNIDIGNTGIRIKEYGRWNPLKHDTTVHWIINNLWKFRAIMVGCQGYSFKNENGEYEWAYDPKKPVAYHEMLIHSMETKNGINYWVMENSYIGKNRMYMKVDNTLNIVRIAHYFILDFTNSRVEVMHRGDENREITLEEIREYGII